MDRNYIGNITRNAKASKKLALYNSIILGDSAQCIQYARSNKNAMGFEWKVMEGLAVDVMEHKGGSRLEDVFGKGAADCDFFKEALANILALRATHTD